MKNNLGDYEINTYTLPYLKKLQHYIPKTKIKIIHHNIIGSSDPFVINNKGKWYGELWDTDGGELSSYRNIECFFTSINMPELHAKQCHLVKNYLVSNNLPTNDTKLIKRIIRTVVRDKPIAPEPDFLAKSFIPNETLFLGPKCRAQYKSASKEQKDKIKYLFKTATINGYVLPNLMTNYRAKQLYLGETK